MQQDRLKIMKKIITALVMSCFTLPSFASSLPDGDISQKFGVATGPSISADFKLNPRTSLGFSLGTPFYRGFFASGNYDVRLLYKFTEQSKFSISGLIGLAGNQYFRGNIAGAPIGIEAGVAMAYQFTPQFAGRLNLVGGVPFLGYGSWGPNAFWNYVAPASGAEIAYKFNRNLEGTLGFNGQGDLLGLNIAF